MTTDAAFWNGLAHKYAAQPVENPDAFERKIAITKAQMPEDATLLEVGCGTGSLALRLAPEAGRIHGVDVSDTMVDIARGKAEAAGAENVTFHVGRFDDSFDALEPGSVDGFLAYSILHLLDDREDTLRRAFDALKPGGFLVASTVCLGESWMPFRPLLAVMRWLGKAPRVVATISRAELRAEVEAAGFVDVEEPDVGAKPIISFLVARKPQG